MLVPRRFLMAPTFFSLPCGAPARELHAIELLAARDLHLQRVRQRVDDRHADAVQAARRVVDLAVELAARVQRGHDHFEGGLRFELGVRIDRNAAAVVGHAEEAVLLDLHLDPGGVAGHRLVHRVVDHLGEQVVQRLLVGAAHVHAGPTPHRLQAFQDLDVGGGIAVCGFRRLTDGTDHGLFYLLLGFAAPWRLLGPAEEIAQGSKTEGCHGCQTPWMAVAGSSRQTPLTRDRRPRIRGDTAMGHVACAKRDGKRCRRLSSRRAPIYHVLYRACGSRNGAATGTIVSAIVSAVSGGVVIQGSPMRPIS